MLPPAHRLRRSEDFTAAVRQGRRAGSATVVAHVRIDPGSDLPARVGVVVGRAVGNAVTRNQVARRLRHVVRGRLPQLPPGSTLVLRARPAAASQPSDRLAADLDRALAKVLSPAPTTPAIQAVPT